MCIAAPGKVIGIKKRRALVEYPDKQIREALLANEEVKVGDFCLVQMGIIVDVLSKSQAATAAKAWES